MQITLRVEQWLIALAAIAVVGGLDLNRNGNCRDGGSSEHDVIVLKIQS